MYSLKTHITQPLVESTTKNAHLEHVEDGVLFDMSEAYLSIHFIEGVMKYLVGQSTNISVTTKWDGSPAIVTGINPDNNLFFVGTKAVFGKRNPKIIYSKKDIQRFYSESPGAARQLEVALEYLPQIDNQSVLQGDMMFGPNEVAIKTIQGREYVTFRPNTILYAIPANTNVADRILRAKMGIIFHTAYKGKTLSDMHSTFNLNLDKLRQTKDVWFDDASIQDEMDSVIFHDSEINTIKTYIVRAEDALDSMDLIKYEEFVTNKTLIGMLRMFTNQEIRAGRQFHSGFIGRFKQYVQLRIEHEKIRESTKEKKKEQYADLLGRLTPTLQTVLEFQENINRAKLLLITKLQQIDSVKTFVPVGNSEYRETKQEGFVVVDKLTNKAVKFVDRLEFSRLNFLQRTQ